MKTVNVKVPANRADETALIFEALAAMPRHVQEAWAALFKASLESSGKNVMQAVGVLLEYDRGLARKVG